MVRPSRRANAPRSGRGFLGVLDGALGYDPDVVTGDPDDPIDYADGAGWFLPAAIETDVAFVQDKVGIDTGPIVTATFDDAPASGNLLVAILTSRSGTSTAAITGWTPWPSSSGITVSGFAPGRLYIFYKTAGSGESSTVTVSSLDGSGKRLYLAEFSGALEFDDADQASASGTSSLTTGPLTPTAGLPALVLGIISQATGSTMTIGGGFTEADEGETSQEAPGGAFGPTTMVGYRIEDPTAGSYTMTASSSQTDDHVGAILSFTTDPAAFIWLPALAVNDGSNTTFDHVYEAGILLASEVFLRSELATDVILSSVVLRLGLEDAGSATVTLEGATDEDFTSPVELDVVTQAATGGYTSDTWTFSPIAEGYVHLRFVLTVAQGARVYEVTLTGLPDPAEAIEGHIADATDAHDASAISYDNSASGLAGDTLQEAIDEVVDLIEAGPASATAAWLPLTSIVAGEPVLVWDGDDSLIPTLIPLE